MNKSPAPLSNAVNAVDTVNAVNNAVEEDLIPLKENPSNTAVNNPAVALILEEIKKGNKVFLTGSGGVGKSFTINLLQQNFTNPLILTPTHQASSVVGGMTIHKAFKLGIARNLSELKANDERVISKIMSSGKSYELASMIYFKSSKELIQIADILIFDEISMVSKQLWDLVMYRLSCWIGDKPLPIIVVGDMYQLPPVLVDKTSQYKLDVLRANIHTVEGKRAYEREVRRLKVKNMNNMVYHSEHWDFVCIELAEIKRSTDIHFIHIQQLIRKGKLTDEVWDFIKKHTVTSKHKPPKNAIRLYPTNDEVNSYNNLCLDVIKYDLKCYSSKATKVDKNSSDEDLKRWAEEELTVDLDLKVKVSAKIIFVATVEGQYFNGERGTVLRTDLNSIVIRKDPTEEQIKQGKKGTIVVLDRFRFTKTSYRAKGGKKTSFTAFECYQFPIRVAYAMTIHKVQGMTIKGAVVIDCTKMWNNKGLFYVAISRVTDPTNLYIKGFRPDIIEPRGDIKKFYRKLKKQGLLTVLKGY